MSRPTFKLTLEALDDRTPVAQRLDRLKLLARDLGLVVVDESSVRSDSISECCKQLCPECRVGAEAVLDIHRGIWWHPELLSVCLASTLRDLKVQLRGDALDAYGDAALPAMLGVAVRRGFS